MHVRMYNIIQRIYVLHTSSTRRAAPGSEFVGCYEKMSRGGSINVGNEEKEKY